MAMDKERESLVEVLTNHIADLRRCQERIEQSDYAEVFKATALEFGKAADELVPVLAALTAQQEPVAFDTIYEWDTYRNAVHRSLDPSPYNGQQPDRAIQVYTAPPSGVRDADGVVVSAINVLINDLEKEAAELLKRGFGEDHYAVSISKQIAARIRYALLAAAKEPRK